jgi:Ca-activated chloride channel family protein
VEVLVPGIPVNYKNEIQKKIATIEPRGWTNLHSGWLEGSLQVSQHLQPQQLNRVLLLSDGLANAEETNPNTIAHHVQGLAQRGVSTTTLGLGEDYNEDLMELMAQSGDGNYYFIESPEQLNAIFQAELQGIMATIGQKVSLGIRPGANVVLLDVFNDLDKTEFGRYKLSNLT